jgi:hypothetical protein
MPERSKRHHFLPQLILRGFDRDGQVGTFDREQQKAFRQSIERAAAENDYNTLLLEDGSLSDTAETLIGSLIEGPAGKVLARIADGGWIETEKERLSVSRFVCFQFLRVPSNREQMDAAADQLMKLDMAAGGPVKLREVLEKQFQRPVTDDEVREHWDAIKDFDDWTLALPREHHVQESLEMVDEFTPALASAYCWCVMRWTRCHLLTSDNPVVLFPPDGSIGPVGLYTAGAIYMSISRTTALVLTHRAVSPLADGQELAGTFAMARRLNGATAATGRRWIYHHPDDNLEDLLGPGWSLPTIAPLTMEDDHSRELRRRLALMSEWAFEHPEEPHPMSPDATRWDWNLDPPGPVEA